MVAADISKLHRRFNWVFEPRYTPLAAAPLSFEARFSILEADYLQGHRATPRFADTHRWAELVIAPLPEIESIVRELHAAHEWHKLARRDRVDSVLACVQAAMAYQPDPSDDFYQQELVRCPIQSLVDGVGDCEDQAILAAALLWRLGFTVALIFLRLREQPGFHCLVGVTGLDDRAVGATHRHKADERDYEYADLTRDGLRLGELADELRGCYGDIVPILAPCPQFATGALIHAEPSR